MEKEGLIDKYSRRIIVALFILVFLYSYSYRFGDHYYEITSWIFFFSMIFAAGLSVLGILMYPLSLIFYEWYYVYMNFLPLAFTTCFLLVISLVTLTFMARGKEKIKTDTNFYLLMFMGSLAVITTLLNGFKIGFGNYEMTHYIEAIMIFLTINIFISTKKRLKFFCWALTFAIAIMAFRAYNHTFTYDMTIWGFENNGLARIFSFCVPFLLGFFWAEKDKYLKYIPLIVLTFVAQNITQLGSRATIISVGIAGFFLFLRNIKKKSAWALAGLAAVLVLVFTPALFIQDIESIFTYVPQGTESEEGSIKGRFDMIEIGWEIVKDNPITGYGVYPRISNTLVGERYEGDKKSLHNSYLIVGVHMGLFGLFAYVGLYISSILLCYQAQKISDDHFIRNVSNGTMYGILALGINQFMVNEPWIPIVFISFGLSSALFYLSKTGRKGKNEISKNLLIILFGLLMLTIFLGLLYLILRLLMG